MTNGKEWKMILLFTLPIMAGNILQQLYNFLDGIMVGNYVSETAFAAVATCNSLTFMYLSLAMGLSVGVGVVTAQYFGAGRHDELPTAIDTAMILLGLCGLALSVFGAVLSPFFLVNLLNVPENILPYAVLYLRIYCVGLFFMFLYNGIAATLRGFGDSKATLYILIVVMLFNTALTFLFVVIFRWGVAGAATSTVLAQTVCAGISYTYLRKRFPVAKAGKHWDGKIARQMVRLGLPVALQMGIAAVGTSFMQRLVNSFSRTVPGIVAAYGAGARVEMLVYVPIMGFQSGLASFTGQNIGAGKLDRVKRGYHSTMVMSAAVTIAISAVFFIFAEPIVSFFGLEKDSIKIGAEMVRFMTTIFWIYSLYTSIGGLLQGAGDTLILSLTGFTSLGIRVALGYISSYAGWLDYRAAWTPVPVGWVFATIILLLRYLSGAWRKKAVAGHFAQGEE